MKILIPALACALGLLASAVQAQTQAQSQAQGSDFPNRPLKIVVPFGPGGASDNVARVLAQKIGEVLKQTVIVENKPGAAGNIAVDAVVRAPADGYTLLLGNVSTNAINPTTYASTLKVNVGKDLTGVSMVASIPHILASSGQHPPSTVAELVKDAKARPGAVNHASAGAGSYAMIDMLMFEKAAGLSMVHVPFKGGAGQFVTAMVGNEVQIAFVNASSAIGLVKGGRLKALAVTTPKRMPELPDVQTMAEAGYAGIGTNAWQGLFVPAGTPRPVVQQLHAAVQSALAQAELRQGFDKLLISAEGSKSPEAFTQFVAAEAARWAKVVKELNVTADQ
jgi:tripartite-type tricarboxylate transporter receptor subunit TctC